MSEIYHFFNYITHILAWVSLPFAYWAIVTLAFDVIPWQLKERKVQDHVIRTRRKLPVLTITFLSLAIVVSSALTTNLFTGRSGHDVYSNLLIISICSMIFIKGYTWKTLYFER